MIVLLAYRAVALFLCIFLFADPLAWAICTTPSVRREWRSLSAPERAEWIRAVKCLASEPHDPALTPSVPPAQSSIVPVNNSGSYYDDFVYVHMDLNTRIHFTGYFFPWHRWYVHVYETALKSRCGFKGTSPYWDWTKDASDVYNATIFKEDDEIDGLGGWGDPADDFQISTGGFAHGFDLAYPAPHRLRRNFTLQPYLPFVGTPFFTDPTLQANSSFTSAEVNKMVTGFTGDFRGFQQYFESFEGAHGSVHLIVGGDLAGTCPRDAQNCIQQPTHSANEPLFWMHHGMVDKVWYEWQHYNKSSNFWAYSGGSVEALTNLSYYEQFPNGAPPMFNLNSTMPADGLFPESTISDVMDTTGGFLCYVYE